MDSDTPVKEVLDDLYTLLESLETQNIAILQFLKDQKIAPDEKLRPYLEQAGNASSVKWRAARARMNHLFAPAPKKATEVATKPAQSAPGAGVGQDKVAQNLQRGRADERSKFPDHGSADRRDADQHPGARDQEDQNQASPERRSQDQANPDQRASKSPTATEPRQPQPPQETPPKSDNEKEPAPASKDTDSAAPRLGTTKHHA